jgi:GH25 family lysozyme M1 (1,4-beta-N-acetylmuramidase)
MYHRPKSTGAHLPARLEIDREANFGKTGWLAWSFHIPHAARLQFLFTIASLMLTASVIAQTHTVCPGPSTLAGVDVSYRQGTIDWNAAAASGIKFAFAEVSEGNFADPAFDQNYAGIKAAGLARGAYVVFHPNLDPIAQTTLLLQKVGPPMAGDLPPMLDVEVTDGQSPATIVAGIQTWVTAVRNATGRPPIILTSAAFWNGAVEGSSSLAANPFGIASFVRSCPILPNAWQNWKFWLHGGGVVPGILIVVDQAEFNGTLADLSDLSIVPFSSFTAAIEIGGHGFEIQGSFSLGIANHEIDPTEEDVTIQVEHFSITIPASSFEKIEKGRFRFNGEISGVRLGVEFFPARRGQIRYVAEIKQANLIITAPVSVILTIGNQRGTGAAETNSKASDFRPCG